MILVVNLNASVDKRYEMKELQKGTVMRAFKVENTPGGKGIHVANVATILGEECIATGFLGGKTGEFTAWTSASSKWPTAFGDPTASTRWAFFSCSFCGKKNMPTA